MDCFLQRHASAVTGWVSGFDRMRFRGTLRMLANVCGMGRFLSYTGRLLKDFGTFVEQSSQMIRQASLEVAESSGRPVVHVRSPSVCKEDLARQIAARDGITDGLICILTAVEACGSYAIRPDRASRKLVLTHAPRRCLHLYHYFMHHTFGFMHVRLQTWLPLGLWPCINGREWLGRQLDQAGVGYVRRDNCFTHIDDIDAARAMLEQQVRFAWEPALAELARQVNPALRRLLGDWNVDYYWSLEESEWATDVMFQSPAALSSLYPSLVHHGMLGLRCPDVLRFLGQPVRADGRLYGADRRELAADVKTRHEGVRLKHRAGRNSVKMYDKQGSVLRVETTLNDMRQLKAPARGTGKNAGKTVWRKMRKGVSDIARRAQVSDAANRRYLEAVSAVESPVPLRTLTDSLGEPTMWHNRRVRGLNLLGGDTRLLESVSGGELLVHGFRNRDLQQALYDKPPADERDARRRAGRVTRQIRLLRAHGLVRKIPRTHRYMVTFRGRQLLSALQSARKADIHKLLKAA